MRTRIREVLGGGGGGGTGGDAPHARVEEVQKPTARRRTYHRLGKTDGKCRATPHYHCYIITYLATKGRPCLTHASAAAPARLIQSSTGSIANHVGRTPARTSIRPSLSWRRRIGGGRAAVASSQIEFQTLLVLSCRQSSGDRHVRAPRCRCRTDRGGARNRGADCNPDAARFDRAYARPCAITANSGTSSTAPSTVSEQALSRRAAGNR
jgi:hypothetical protein